MRKVLLLVCISTLCTRMYAQEDITAAPAAPALEKSGVSMFIDGLNNALELEYAAAVQYIQHAAVMTGPQYGTAISELSKHAKEELGHAAQVADLINYLGGTPSTNVEKRLVAQEPQKMLEQDLAGEQVAVDGYKKLVKQANELGEYGISHVLSGILATEEEHKRDLLHALGR